MWSLNPNNTGVYVFYNVFKEVWMSKDNNRQLLTQPTVQTNVVGPTVPQKELKTINFLNNTE